MGKGRDKRLIELRNKMLCRRWFYWTEIARLRFDDTVKVFFISEERVMNIIRECYNQAEYNSKQFNKPKNNNTTHLFDEK